ncbi:MAG: OsmC family protein [Usitatibacter sp.]
MSENVDLAQVQDYRFEITFAPGGAALVADESPPLGGGAGPTPLQLLAAGVGNCLSASLLFALRKYKQAPEPIRTHVEPRVGRNESNRLRIAGIDVRITLGVPAASLANLDRALAQFEDFCTVTASVRGAIPVNVEVFDRDGARIK